MRYHASTIVGMGTDVVPVVRIERLVRDHAARLPRIFTDCERAYCDGCARRRGMRYAAVFAAKEAVMKALGTGWRSDIELSEIETRALNACGEVLLSGGTRNAAAALGVARILVCLASTADAGMATAVATGRSV